MQLASRQPDGSTLREHLLAVAALSGRPDPRLGALPPRAGLGLWEAFVALSASRPAGFGASAIPLSEVEAWQRLHGVRLSSWEVDALLAMDRAALEVMSEQQRARSKT